jgi:hypothetical protein
MPQERIWPNMARTMVEDAHNVKLLARNRCQLAHLLQAGFASHQGASSVTLRREPKRGSKGDGPGASAASFEGRHSASKTRVNALMAATSG